MILATEDVAPHKKAPRRQKTPKWRWSTPQKRATWGAFERLLRRNQAMVFTAEP